MVQARVEEKCMTVAEALGPTDTDGPDGKSSLQIINYLTQDGSSLGELK